MSFDWLAYPLGKFLKLIYDITFHNYGLAIIIFTFIVRLVILPLTVKQQKSSMKMQEIQPLINDIQKRYKNDKDKMNQELMKVYQEYNYNPASGCLPALIQLPIILTLYWVIVQPLKFMLGKDPATQIPQIVEVAAKGMGTTPMKMGVMKEMLALNYFNEHQDALSQVAGLLDKSELIDFRSFLGLHLGKIASYYPKDLFGPEWKTYIPLFILVVLSTVTILISTKLSMPKTNTENSSKNKNKNEMPAGCNNSMLYVPTLMTLLISFKTPAGVVLYWMTGYVFGIFQQLFINKYVLKKNKKTEQTAAAAGKNTTADGSSTDNTEKTSSSSEDSGTINKEITEKENNEEKKQLPAGGKNGGKQSKKGGGKKGRKKK